MPHILSAFGFGCPGLDPPREGVPQTARNAYSKQENN